MKRTYKYRLFTNSTQEANLVVLLGLARNLYNCALEHRILCYNTHKKSISYYEQADSLKEIRSYDEQFKLLNSSCSQNVLRQLDKAFQTFFRRIKNNEKPGFPRFKPLSRFNSITFPSYGDGVKIKAKKLYIRNVGCIRINFHRSIVGTIKTVTIKRTNNKFYACFNCDDVPKEVLVKTNKSVGIDVGIKSFAVYSDKTDVNNPKYLKQSEEKLKSIQSKYSKHKSKNTKKKLTKLHIKVSYQRRDFQHKLSKDIINNYDIICVEKLNISNMLKSESSSLNKNILDASWFQFTSMLRYKAESADRVFIEVNPNNTSQICSACNKYVSKTLSERMHVCTCGFVSTRDHNAALNILALGLSACTKQEAVSFN